MKLEILAKKRADGSQAVLGTVEDASDRFTFSGSGEIQSTVASCQRQLAARMGSYRLEGGDLKQVGPLPTPRQVLEFMRDHFDLPDRIRAV